MTQSERLLRSLFFFLLLLYQGVCTLFNLKKKLLFTNQNTKNSSLVLCFRDRKNLWSYYVNLGFHFMIIIIIILSFLQYVRHQSYFITGVTGARSVKFAFQSFLMIYHLILKISAVSCSWSRLLRSLPAQRHHPTSCTTRPSTCSPTLASALQDRPCLPTPTIPYPCRYEPRPKQKWTINE